MKVLVTGGAGYIGSHVCKALAQVGHQPVVFDNFSTGHHWAVKWGPVVEGDLQSLTDIRAALRSHKIEAVIHLAGSIAVGESVENPRKYFENNVVNAVRLLGAMLDEEVQHLVFSSTAAVYGNPQVLPITERHPISPVNPYGVTKVMTEQLLEAYSGAYTFRHVALRYFNASGADMDGELGESHDPETHLIPLAIQAALGHRGALKLFGTDYPTPDGTAIRDYIHVSDLAGAHVRALDYLVRGGKSVQLNLGTGHGVSVRELINGVEGVTERKVPFSEAPRRAGDPPVLIADPSLAATVLDWRPTSSDLRTIIESAWRWHSMQV